MEFSISTKNSNTHYACCVTEAIVKRTGRLSVTNLTSEINVSTKCSLKVLLLQHTTGFSNLSTVQHFCSDYVWASIELHTLARSYGALGICGWVVNG